MKKEQIWFLLLGSLAALAIIGSGLAAGIQMLIDERPTSDAVVVMAVPFAGVILLGAVGGILFVLRERTPDLQATASDRLRLRIVLVLGIALFVGLVGVLLIAAFSERDVPGALLTLVSTIAGGLIGVLVPAGAGAPSAGTVSAPTVTQLSPPKGKVAGGDRITIIGTGFQNVTGVKFGAIPAAGFSTVSSTQIIVVAPPAHAAGTVDVIVTTGAGDSSPTSASRYTFE
jgi:hypothetical protein